VSADVAPADVTTTPTTPPASEGPVAPVNPAPAAPADAARPVKAKPSRGKLVSYVFRDPITGDQLDGHGVVVDVPEGGALAILPLAVNFLFVPAGDVQVVELDG
jgi:hypothetical protein